MNKSISRISELQELCAEFGVPNCSSCGEYHRNNGSGYNSLLKTIDNFIQGEK